MTADEQREFDELRAQYDRLVKILTEVGDYAGVEIVQAVSPEPPMGQLLAFPAGRAPRKRAAGGGLRVTSFVGAPCRVTNLGSAS